MPLQTLDEFIERPDRDGLRGGFSAYVREKGFASLYVRLSPKVLNGVVHERVFTVASVEVKKKGQGTFTALLERLQAMGFIVYVESVMNDRFAEWLVRNKFEVCRIDLSGRSFFRFPPGEADGRRAAQG